MRAHTDEEIISKALSGKTNEEYKDGKIDVAVDLDDEIGTAHTYVVTFQKDDSGLKPVDISELSSL